MSRLLLTAVLWLVSGLCLRAEIDISRFLEAIAFKETGTGWDGRPGPSGELSRYQITETVWRQHMGTLPFAAARDPVMARTCAQRHIRWLIAGIDRRSLAVTPQRVATVWHYGLSRARRQTQWGLELANLYSDLP